ncbi:hypothetical protein ACR73E_04345 [Bifidobacterium dentium]
MADLTAQAVALWSRGLHGLLDEDPPGFLARFGADLVGQGAHGRPVVVGHMGLFLRSLADLPFLPAGLVAGGAPIMSPSSVPNTSSGSHSLSRAAARISALSWRRILSASGSSAGPPFPSWVLFLWRRFWGA